jgi:hypothetical protein
VPSLTAAQKRLAFREKSTNQPSSKADVLAEQVGVPAASRLDLSRTRSERFVWYRDDDMLTLVVGDQEGAEVDTALAIGLAERGQRELRLVLPRGWHESTLHRWAWLRDDLPLRVWSHHDGVASSSARPTRQQTQDLVHGAEKPMLHLGERTGWVESLMRWAGEQSDLDASHRPDVRAWQCRGQRVLRIKRQGASLEIIAGINWGAASPHSTPTPLLITDPLTSSQDAELREQVAIGCAQRLNGIAKKADEHWLQAVLRRHPRELGLEQPVLRELAAWRPSGTLGTTQAAPRGRGFVDLAGLDASGMVLLVETKLGADHMLVLQGLDYLIWAEANRERLTLRLDCRPDAPLEIAYCVGGKNGGTPTWSAHAGEQLEALAPDLRWHVQEVTGWTGDTAKSRRGALHTYPLPTAAA